MPRSVSAPCWPRSSIGGATPIHAVESPGVGEAAKDVRGHAENVAKLGLELARAEARAKGVAVALGLGTAVLALFGLGFLLATIAAALAIVVDTWLALLIVALGLLAVAAGLGLAARARFASGAGPERRDLEDERKQFETAAEQLKRSVGEATDVNAKLRDKLPAVAAGALGTGFFFAGGIGATMRFLARKGRER